MVKWIWRFLLVGVFGFIGWNVYDYYRAGLHTRPDMPPGSFSISYSNGLRAILVDVTDERETRRYFGYPAVVPFYVEEAWSVCSPPLMTERAEADRWLAEANQPGMRIEAICRIDVDGETIIRGIITTVPRL